MTDHDSLLSKTVQLVSVLKDLTPGQRAVVINAAQQIIGVLESRPELANGFEDVVISSEDDKHGW